MTGGAVGYSVLVVSDSRDENNDESGRALQEALGGGYLLTGKYFCKNDGAAITEQIKKITDSGCGILICVGGTGISGRDVTVDAARQFIAKEIPGFAELFRHLSYERIGTRAILSRALLGITRHSAIICCLPGSPDAVRLAAGEILRHEIPHIISELAKK